MPFGKRLLTSAVEGESKQSCVIFSFYFMPLAATKHDGCGSLVFFRIVHHLNHIYKYWHTASAHVSLFYIHRPFFLGKGELIAKIQIFLEYVSVFIIFCILFMFYIRILFIFVKI